MAAAEQTLAWVADPERLADVEARRIDGRVRRHASQEGRTLGACLDVGLRGDPRLDVLAESLVATQWPDGGRNCDRHRECVHSSFHESWGPILGLARYGATDAVERGAELLLQHRVVTRTRRARPPRVEAPPGRQLAHRGEVVEAPPARRGATSRPVDWGETANEVLTEQALGVLRAAGRL